MPGKKLPFSDVPGNQPVPGGVGASPRPGTPRAGGPHVDPPDQLAPRLGAPRPIGGFDEGPRQIDIIGGSPRFSRGQNEHAIRHRLRGRKGFKPPKMYPQ